MESILSNVPIIREDTRYWLVRSGVESKYFNEFYKNNQIALGWELINNIDMFKKDLNADRVKRIVKGKYSDFLIKLADVKKTNISRRITDITNKIWRFVNELKIGDIIVTPGNEEVLIGEVLSEAYIVKGIYNKKSRSLDDTIVGELNKVRNVKWIKKIKRDDLEPNIRLNINVNHGISQITNSQVITEINRAIYKFYITNEDAHSIIMVKNQNEIDFEEYAKFIGHTYSIYNILKDDNQNERLTIKTNIQSPGPIEFIGSATLICTLTVSLIALLKNKLHLLDNLNDEKQNQLKEYKEKNIKEDLEDYDFPFDGSF